MDLDVYYSKIESINRSVLRLEDKRPDSLDRLLVDIDLQDILSVNLERLVQSCVDLASMMIAELNIPPADTMSEGFNMLADHTIISSELAGNLKKSVGFRNIAVHQYQRIDWVIVFSIVADHLDTFKDFARQIEKYLGISR